MSDKIKLHVVYYDTDFPINEDNLFLSTGTYKSTKDWIKNSEMSCCRPIMLIDLSRFDLKKFKVSSLIPFLDLN